MMTFTLADIGSEWERGGRHLGRYEPAPLTYVVSVLREAHGVFEVTIEEERDPGASSGDDSRHLIMDVLRQVMRRLHEGDSEPLTELHVFYKPAK